jgi:hypothetical protein
VRWPWQWWMALAEVIAAAVLQVWVTVIGHDPWAAAGSDGIMLACAWAAWMGGRDARETRRYIDGLRGGRK